MCVCVCVCVLECVNGDCYTLKGCLMGDKGVVMSDVKGNKRRDVMIRLFIFSLFSFLQIYFDVIFCRIFGS